MSKAHRGGLFSTAHRAFVPGLDDRVSPNCVACLTWPVAPLHILTNPRTHSLLLTLTHSYSLLLTHLPAAPSRLQELQAALAYGQPRAAPAAPAVPWVGSSAAATAPAPAVAASPAAPASADQGTVTVDGSVLARLQAREAVSVLLVTE